MDMRLRELEVVEKRVRHIEIIVLPGMNQHIVDWGPLVRDRTVILLDSSYQGSHLHKVRPCSCNQDHLHYFIPLGIRICSIFLT
jgi:hypothetical protein